MMSLIIQDVELNAYSHDNSLTILTFFETYTF